MLGCPPPLHKLSSLYRFNENAISSLELGPQQHIYHLLPGLWKTRGPPKIKNQTKRGTNSGEDVPSPIFFSFRLSELRASHRTPLLGEVQLHLLALRQAHRAQPRERVSFAKICGLAGNPVSCFARLEAYVCRYRICIYIYMFIYACISFSHMAVS